MMETLRSEYVKASKQYQCDYCGNVIEKGRTYHRSVHKFDNGMYVWRCHTECYELAGVIWDLVDPDEGMTADEVLERTGGIGTRWLRFPGETWAAYALRVKSERVTHNSNSGMWDEALCELDQGIRYGKIEFYGEVK